LLITQLILLTRARITLTQRLLADFGREAAMLRLPFAGY